MDSPKSLAHSARWEAQRIMERTRNGGPIALERAIADAIIAAGRDEARYIENYMTSRGRGYLVARQENRDGDPSK